jgi:prepilin-type N-terminal cleavage/methylation domain-containing protein
LRRKQGISLIELLIAIFVIAVGVLGTVSALWYGIRSEKYSERRSNAVSQSRELLNAMKAQQYPFAGSDVVNSVSWLTIGSHLNDGDYDNDGDDDSSRRAFNEYPFENLYPTNEFNFERRIEMKRLSNNVNNYQNDLVAIKVSIFWNEGRHEKEVTLWGYSRRP